MNARKAAVVIVVFATALSFWPVAHAEFSTWDDPHNISENLSMISPVPGELKFYWTHKYGDLYVPVTYTFWMGISHFARVIDADGSITLNPWIFHLANLITHAIASLLVLRVLWRLGFDVLPACAGALVFAIHPVQVESVAWITGFRDVLGGMFCMLAVDQCLSVGESNRALWTHRAVALLAFILAMLSKPSAVALPMVLVAMDYFLRDKSRKRIAFDTAPFFLLAIPIIIVGKIAQPATLIAPIPIWWRPLVAGDALAFYFLKVLWPARLGLDYGHTPQWVVQSGVGYFAWLVPFAIALLVARARRGSKPTFSTRAMAAGTCVFAAAVSPLLGFFTFEFQLRSTVADHYLYVSMLGAALVVAGTLTPLQSRLALRRASIVITSIALVAMGVRTWFATGNWHDSYAIFENTIRVNPDSVVGHNNLLYIALDDSKSQLAEREAQWLARRKPDDMNAQLTLGRALASEGRLAEAKMLFEVTSRRWPEQPLPHLSLAAVLLDLHRPADALAEYDAAQRIDPQTPKLPELRARAEAMLVREKSATQRSTQP